MYQCKGGRKISKPVFSVSVVFGALFLGTLALSLAFPRESVSAMSPGIKEAVALADRLVERPSGQREALMLGLIFLKNFSVVALVLVFGSRLKGLPLAAVCAANGAALGTAVVTCHADGVPYAVLAGLILPHGVVEFPVLFLACGLGYSLAREGVALKGRLAAGARLAVPLAAAALVEVFVTPEVGAWLAKMYVF